MQKVVWETIFFCGITYTDAGTLRLKSDIYDLLGHFANCQVDSIGGWIGSQFSPLGIFFQNQENSNLKEGGKKKKLYLVALVPGNWRFYVHLNLRPANTPTLSPILWQELSSLFVTWGPF